jgi:hypothetical protein
MTDSHDDDDDDADGAWAALETACHEAHMFMMECKQGVWEGEEEVDAKWEKHLCAVLDSQQRLFGWCEAAVEAHRIVLADWDKMVEEDGWNNPWLNGGISTVPPLCLQVWRQVSWALPTRSFLDKAVQFVTNHGGHLLGVGSGHGYLEACVELAGHGRLHVTATNPDTKNEYVEPSGITLTRPDRQCMEEALDKHGAGVGVLMCAFPPPDSPWLTSGLARWRRDMGGAAFLVVRQWRCASFNDGTPCVGCQSHEFCGPCLAGDVALDEELRAHWQCVVKETLPQARSCEQTFVSIAFMYELVVGGRD